MDGMRIHCYELIGLAEELANKLEDNEKPHSKSIIPIILSVRNASTYTTDRIIGIIDFEDN